jgi:8-oxo-dGTP diphosphatase
MAQHQMYPVATDAAVFTVTNATLKLLLIKRRKQPYMGMHALPGGFLEEYDAGLDECAARELLEETGVKNIYLKMLHAYGNKGRDPRGRVISIAYLALIRAEEVQLNSSKFSEDAEWVALDSIEGMAFDHKQIVEEAVGKLRRELFRSNIAARLLTDKFTLTELQKTYEVILGHAQDKRNFRKWVKNLDILRATKEKKMEGVHRPAELYEFKQRGYFRFRDY